MADHLKMLLRDIQDEEEAIMSDLQHLTAQIMPQACAVHCLLSCLESIHRGPELLKGAHNQLESLMTRMKLEEDALGIDNLDKICMVTLV